MFGGAYLWYATEVLDRSERGSGPGRRAIGRAIAGS